MSSGNSGGGRRIAGFMSALQCRKDLHITVQMLQLASLSYYKEEKKHLLKILNHPTTEYWYNFFKHLLWSIYTKQNIFVPLSIFNWQKKIQKCKEIKT